MAEAVSQGVRERPRIAFYVLIIGAMVLGLLVGPIMGTRASVLGEVGKLVIQLIKAVATPLVFFAILNAVLKTEVKLRAGLHLLVFATLNATIALSIGLLLSNVLQPGHYLGRVLSQTRPLDASAYTGRDIDLLETFRNLVPTSLVTPFSENSVLTIAMLALLIGFGLRAVRQEQATRGVSGFASLEHAVTSILRVLEIVLGWVIKLVPFAVFAVVTKTVGEHGYAPFQGLGVYVAVGLGGLLLHAVVTYQLWIALVARIPLRLFWKEAREPVVYGIGTNSSLATLPVTLAALDRLGVSRSSSTLGACVGTNLNNDGILLYEAMAMLFIAQASGIELSVTQQIVAALACMVAAMGVAGVPEAGFISLALVLNTVGLPIELLPLLLTVDWVVARARSAINVLSDMVLSILIDRFGRKDHPVAGL